MLNSAERKHLSLWETVLVWVTFVAENKTVGIDRDIFNRSKMFILQKLKTVLLMRKTLCFFRKSGGSKILLTLEFEALHGILNRDRLHIHFSSLLRTLEWVVCTYVVSELHWILS